METEGIRDEATPGLAGGGTGAKAGRWRWLRAAGVVGIILAIPILFILLSPLEKPSVVSPVTNEPIPALDVHLGRIEARLRALDKRNAPYPSEREMRKMVPKGIKLLVITGSSEMLVIDVSREDGVWRTMTHERNKPQATTFITVRKSK